MRAINLIPPDQQRGAGGVAGRSGGAAYVLVGLLALLVVLFAMTKLQQRGLADKREQLAQTQVDAARSEAESTELAPFTQFAALRSQRSETIRGLASARFDWAHTLKEVARVTPDDAWLTSLQATTVPGVALKNGAAGPTSSLRSAIPTPAIEMVGCTTRQESVARLVTRLRLVDGVTRVALQSSVKGVEADTGASQGAAAVDGASTAADCRRGQAKYPQFAIVAFLDRAAGAVPTTARSSRVSAAVSDLSPPTIPAPETTP